MIDARGGEAPIRLAAPPPSSMPPVCSAACLAYRLVRSRNCLSLVKQRSITFWDRHSFSLNAGGRTPVEPFAFRRAIWSNFSRLVNHIPRSRIACRVEGCSNRVALNQVTNTGTHH